MPELATNPNTYYWYLFLSTFSPVLLKAWAERHVPAAPAKKEKVEDKDSLFGSDDDEPAAPKEKKPKKEPKKEEPKKEVKKKEKPIAKSIVVFDVKVYEVMSDA